MQLILTKREGTEFQLHQKKKFYRQTMMTVTTHHGKISCHMVVQFKKLRQLVFCHLWCIAQNNISIHIDWMYKSVSLRLDWNWEIPIICWCHSHFCQKSITLLWWCWADQTDFIATSIKEHVKLCTQHFMEVRRNGYIASFFSLPRLPCLSVLLALINKKFITIGMLC